MIALRDVVGNRRRLYAGNVQIDSTCGMIDVAAKVDLEATDEVVSYSLPFYATQAVHDFDTVAGDQFGIGPMLVVPTVLFGDTGLTYETSGKLTEQHIPNPWKISRADRSVVIRDAVGGYVTKVESYRHGELIGVRSLVRIPVP
ncbi:hypothetical protein ACQPXH_24025 [Nocardia sp. CA-135953]|uniref:hypothetical protein n=1 Tax=Nocardia sp. CA-135953 TaxID=3239978 RepID=UPI003D9889AC